MRCLIVDDNQMARMAMKQLVEQVQMLELVAECSDAMQAYNYLRNDNIDLIFLDIEMPDMTGIELTKKLGNKKALIIFTTATFPLSKLTYCVRRANPPKKPFHWQTEMASLPDSENSFSKYAFCKRVSHSSRRSQLFGGHHCGGCVGNFQR